MNNAVARDDGNSPSLILLPLAINLRRARMAWHGVG